jgi:TetR/AcrR family transcriptional repressor of nem operon
MSVGRPLEYDPEIALDTAMRLFWRKGYETTSLQDLLSEMGLSKSSFYQAYESKHALFEKCVEHYQATRIDKLNTQIDKHRSARAFLEAAFMDVANETRDITTRKGCLLMNTASEFGQTDPSIAKLVADSLDQITTIFKNAIERAQQNGEIPAQKNATELASYLVSTMSGLENMVKAGKDRQTIKHIAKTALSVLN